MARRLGDTLTIDTARAGDAVGRKKKMGRASPASDASSTRSDPSVSPNSLAPTGSVAAMLQSAKQRSPPAGADSGAVNPGGGSGDAPPSPHGRMSFQQLSLTLVGLNGLQKQRRLADFTIADDLKELRQHNKKRVGEGRGDDGGSGSGSGDKSSKSGAALTPLSKLAREQWQNLDSMLTESASMTAGIDALLNRLSMHGNKAAGGGPIGGDGGGAVQKSDSGSGGGGGNTRRAHRRQLSRSLPDLRAATLSEEPRFWSTLPAGAAPEQKSGGSGANAIAPSAGSGSPPSRVASTLQQQPPHGGGSRGRLHHQPAPRSSTGASPTSSAASKAAAKILAEARRSVRGPVQRVGCGSSRRPAGSKHSAAATATATATARGDRARPALARAAADFQNTLRATASSPSLSSAVASASSKASPTGASIASCFGAYSLTGADAYDNDVDDDGGDDRHNRTAVTKQQQQKKKRKTKTRNKRNQDTFLVARDFPEPGALVLAVFDGHGVAGKRCSQLCADKFVALLRQAHFDEKVKACGSGGAGGAGTLNAAAVLPSVTRAFTHLQRALHHAAFDTTHSGTTATAAVLLPGRGKLVTMNCGDSNLCLGSLFDNPAASGVGAGLATVHEGRPRGVSLGDQNDAQGRQSNGSGSRRRSSKAAFALALPKFRIKFAFKAHSPTNAKERARIEAAGGVVRRLDGDVDRVWAVDPEDDDDGSFSESDDDYDSGDSGDDCAGSGSDRNNDHRGGRRRRRFRGDGAGCGLAMSRSLGDEDLHAVGVTCEPEVRVHDLCLPRDQFLVLASDGVWDRATAFDVVELVHQAQVGAAAAAAGGGGKGKKARGKRHGGVRAGVQGSAVGGAGAPHAQGRGRTSSSDTSDSGDDAAAAALGRGDGGGATADAATAASASAWDAGEAAKHLCHLARSRWVERRGRVDDVTAVVVNLALALGS